MKKSELLAIALENGSIIKTTRDLLRYAIKGYSFPYGENIIVGTIRGAYVSDGKGDGHYDIPLGYIPIEEVPRMLARANTQTLFGYEGLQALHIAMLTHRLSTESKE